MTAIVRVLPSDLLRALTGPHLSPLDRRDGLSCPVCDPPR